MKLIWVRHSVEIPLRRYRAVQDLRRDARGHRLSISIKASARIGGLGADISPRHSNLSGGFGPRLCE